MISALIGFLPFLKSDTLSPTRFPGFEPTCACCDYAYVQHFGLDLKTSKMGWVVFQVTSSDHFWGINDGVNSSRMFPKTYQIDFLYFNTWM